MGQEGGGDSTGRTRPPSYLRTACALCPARPPSPPCAAGAPSTAPLPVSWAHVGKERLEGGKVDPGPPARMRLAWADPTGKAGADVSKESCAVLLRAIMWGPLWVRDQPGDTLGEVEAGRASHLADGAAEAEPPSLALWLAQGMLGQGGGGQFQTHMQPRVVASLHCPSPHHARASQCPPLRAHTRTHTARGAGLSVSELDLGLAEYWWTWVWTPAGALASCVRGHQSLHCAWPWV